jgi:hypothetical protein
MNLISLDEDENEILDINSIRNLPNSYHQGILSFPFLFQERRNMEYFNFEEPSPEIDSEIFSNVFPNQIQRQSDDNTYLFSVTGNNNSNMVIPEIDLSENINILDIEEILTLEGIDNTNFSLMKPYSLEEIRNLLRENKISNNIIGTIKDCINPLDWKRVGYFDIKIKRTRKGIIKEEKDEEKFLGRKRKDDNKKGNHTRNDVDNIMKKCKNTLFHNVIEYVALIVNSLKSDKKEEFLLLNLSYEYIDILKKDNELALFKMKLKELVSLDISSKYSLIEDKEFNKKNINKILKEERDNEVLINLLNMRFGDWIDVFTLKKKIEIEPKFKGLEKALKEISDKNDEEYFSRFIFFLFNYKNYFQNKKGRRPKTNSNKRA